MTINMSKYFENLIKKEAKISHLGCTVMSCKKNAIPSKIAASIQKKYGESFLLDANYVVFFKTNAEADAKFGSKLFELVNRALGKDANSLTKGDFKSFTVEETVAEDDAAVDASVQDAPVDVPAEAPAEEPAEEPEEAPIETAPAKEYILLKITVK